MNRPGSCVNFCIQTKLGYDLNREVCPAIVATNYKEPPMLLMASVGGSDAQTATEKTSTRQSTVASGKGVPPNSTEGGGVHPHDPILVSQDMRSTSSCGRAGVAKSAEEFVQNAHTIGCAIRSIEHRWCSRVAGTLCWRDGFKTGTRTPN